MIIPITTTVWIHARSPVFVSYDWFIADSLNMPRFSKYLHFLQYILRSFLGYFLCGLTITYAVIDTCTGVPRDTTVFGTENLVVCRISMNIKFITELEELESMISCILFKIMFRRRDTFLRTRLIHGDVHSKFSHPASVKFFTETVQY